MRGSSYTIFFAGAVSIILSVILSVVSMLLKERQAQNRALEEQYSILKAAQVNLASKDEASKLYEKLVTPLIINNAGEKLSNIKLEEVEFGDPEKAALFAIRDINNNQKINSYVYPIVGSGLWSKLYGYLAVDSLGKKILGITFYKQGETPGLGAEIEKAWFTSNFKNKSLFDKSGKLSGINIAKSSAKIDPRFKEAPNRTVDGISGATITARGVEEMLKKGPARYEPFFRKLRDS